MNGVRAAFKKDFLSKLAPFRPDVICLQETKCSPDQLDPEQRNPSGWHAEWCCGERPGYSGVATLSKEKPLGANRAFGVERFDREGRLLETDHGLFTLVNVYYPNGGSGEERLRYKLDFYEEALKRFKKLRSAGKSLVLTGDFNVAHKPVDVALPEKWSAVSGFLPEERAWMDRLVAAGFVDAFREFDSSGGRYTWWEMRTLARGRNEGWRLDYHFVSADLRDRLEEAFILDSVLGSDHCPVGIVLRAD